MTNTNEPSQEMGETNQSEDLINPQLNKENPKDELHEDLNQLRILSDELKNTKEPSQVSFATSLQKIIEPINIADSEITNLSEYRARMREHYGTGISKEDIKNLNITKDQLWRKFIDPRIGQPPDVRKRQACMDWCNYLPWRENRRKIRFLKSLHATMSRSHSIFSGKCGLIFC